MTFTMPQYPVPNKQQSNPYADLIKNALQAYENANRAQYTPQLIQADIFSKEFAPLAQIASSPLALAMMPDQRNQINNLISQLLQQMGMSGVSNQQQVGIIPSQGNFQQQTNLPMQSSSQQGSGDYNPSIPQAGQNLGTGATTKVTAPYNEQVHGAGVSFYDPNTGKFYSQPTESTIAVSQQAINAIKRVLPQLKEIAEESKDFLSPGGMLSTYASGAAGQISNWTGISLSPEIAKKFGIDPEKFSRYAGWQANIGQVVDSLMSSYPNLPKTEESLRLMGNIVTPQSGETYNGYITRIMNIINKLSEQQLPMIQQQLTPIPISNEPVKTTQKENRNGYNPIEILNYKFSSPEEFQEAFKTLDKESQKKVINEMRRRGMI